MIDTETLVAAMARVIKQRKKFGWSTADTQLTLALLRAGFSAAEINRHLDAAKTAADEEPVEHE